MKKEEEKRKNGPSGCGEYPSRVVTCDGMCLFEQEGRRGFERSDSLVEW